MVNLFRRHRQPLLIVFTIFAIFAFVIFYNLPAQQRNGRSDIATTLYGRGVTTATLGRLDRHFELAQDTGMIEMLRALVGDSRSMAQAQAVFPYRLLILRHAAEELGILSANPSEAEQRVLDEEVFKRIQAMPAFQRNGGFDPASYAMFGQFRLSPRGMTPKDLEELVADQIRFEKVKAVVGATTGSTTAEIKDYYTERFGKVEVSVTRLKLEDFKAAAQVTDEDTKKLFEERKGSLKTPEKRKVKFALFAPPASDQPAVGTEKAKQMQALSAKAQDFAQAMTAAGANFDAEAARFGATVGETPLFEPGKPPAELESSSKVAAAAFRLTTEQPNSDVVSAAKGLFVLQLSGSDPARPLTYEEAKADLTKQLQEERGQEAMNLKGTDLRTKIDADLKAGKTFADAATAAGGKPEKLAPFSLSDRLKDDPDAGTILARATQMTEGQLSEFLPSESGGLLIHLDKKLPIDLADYDKQKAALQQELENDRQQAMFMEWLKGRVKAAGMASVLT